MWEDPAHSGWGNSLGSWMGWSEPLSRVSVLSQSPRVASEGCRASEILHSSFVISSFVSRCRDEPSCPVALRDVTRTLRISLP